MEVYKMNIEKCKKNKRFEQPTIQVNIRITTELSEWLKKENFSPTGIFLEGCLELGFKSEK